MRILRLLTVAFAVAFLSVAAWGGEVYIGTITSYDGGVTSNRYLSDGGFGIGYPMRVSLQCSADCYICTDRDRASCDATRGVKVLAETLFPTSVDNSSNALAPTLPDGGFTVIGGGLISVVPATSSAAMTCDVFGRSGRE